MVQIPFWKKWFSYIVEYELEKVESDHGHELSLCLSDGRIQLNTHKAIYSWEDKYDNFYKAFANMNWNEFTGQDVLSLGFGLGSIPQMLEEKFKKSFYYTGVEIDENVIYLAEKYVLHQLKSSIQIIQAPAEIFVETCQEKFDLITIDIFINDKIPTDIKSYDFLAEASELLSEGGLLLYNHLSNRESEVKVAKNYFKHVFKSIFPNAVLLDVDGNYIFFSDGKYLDVDNRVS